MEDKTNIERQRVAQSFNRKVSRFIRLANQKLPNNPKIIQAENIITIAMNDIVFKIIESCKDKIWSNRKSILNRDEAYFLTHNFEEYIQEDEDGRLARSVIQLVHTYYESLTPQEKEFVWEQSEEMLRDVCEYKKVIGDYVNR
jgi:hypothetical protein